MSRYAPAPPLPFAESRRYLGFSYIEVLVAVVIMAVALVPAIESLRASSMSAGAQTQMADQEAWLSSLLEATLAERFSALDTEAVRVADPTIATAYSDAVGTPSRRLVYLSRYDGDDADGDGNGFTGTDSNLLWIRVALENSPYAFETLTSR